MKWTQPKTQIQIKGTLKVMEIFSSNYKWKIALCWHTFEGYTIDIYKWQEKEIDWKFINTNMDKIPSYVMHEFHCQSRQIEITMGDVQNV